MELLVADIASFFDEPLKDLQFSVIELAKQAKVATDELRMERENIQQQCLVWQAKVFAYNEAQIAESRAKLKSLKHEIAQAEDRLQKGESEKSSAWEPGPYLYLLMSWSLR